MRTNIEFNANGIKLRGWLYLPDEGTAPFPTIVMSNGFALTKEPLARLAQIFGDAGLACVLYDNRCLGASDGEPRQLEKLAITQGFRTAVAVGVPLLIGLLADRVSIGMAIALGALFVSLVVKTSGSVYRRAGARMLLTEDGQTIGTISGGCLESDIFERAQEVMFYSSEPILVQYDTTSSDDIVWGLGLGCNGVVHVLIEFLSNTFASSQLDFIADCFAQNQPGVIATIFQVRGETQIKVAERLFFKQDGTVINNIVDSQFAQKVQSESHQVLQDGRSCVKSYLLSNSVAEVLLKVIQPLVELVIFGAGHDAIPVVHFAKQLGWHVTLIDYQLSYATRDRFNHVDNIVLCNLRERAGSIHRPLQELICPVSV